MGSIPDPVRIPDLLVQIRSRTFPECYLPLAVGPVMSLTAAPVQHRRERVGDYFYVAEKEDDEEFTREDEETLVMFASQSAGVISNARKYRDEQRAWNDLGTLLQTSPVGLVVFDARTGPGYLSTGKGDG